MRRKGFTLIELLAVVLVLGIIAIIAVPSINNLLEKGKANALSSTANGLIDATKQYYLNEVMTNGSFSTGMTIDINDNSNMSLIDYKGKLPSTGYIILDSTGNVGIAVVQGKYCAKKEVNKSKIEVTTDTSNCGITSLADIETINKSCFVLNSAMDTITGYKSSNAECSSDVVIPASIANHEITAISDNAFNDGNIILYYNSYYDSFDIKDNWATSGKGYNYAVSFKIDPALLTKRCFNPATESSTTVAYDYKMPQSSPYEYCQIGINSGSLWNYTSSSKYVTSVDLSGATNLRTIGDTAFFGNSISSVDFGNLPNLTSIGSSAFAFNYITGTLDLSGLTGLTEISGATFGENQIETVTLPSTIKNINSYAFSNNNISSVIFPNVLESIGEGSFCDNNLETITIPASVTSIGDRAFEDNNWSSVTIENNAQNNKYRFNDDWTNIGWPEDLMVVEPPPSPIDYALTTGTNEFTYFKSHYNVTVQTSGTYKLEVWGAQGNNSGGLGGYSSGEVYLTSGTILYVYAGGTNGFNGGGASYTSSSGGGGTDIRIGTDSLYARVIVAGGGGTGGQNTPGVGGGLTGTSTQWANGGTQISFGTGYNNVGNGSFGSGGSDATNSNPSGGGGGWYGGGSDNNNYAGGGGSGWIYTSDALTNWQTGNATDAANWLLNSSYYLSNASTVDGASSMPTHDGTSTMIGNTSNGYAKITYVG